MACMHGVVDFLYDEKGLKGVDGEFRPLVEALHRIPFCASFGVSCAGHFFEGIGDGGKNIGRPIFLAEPWGHLRVIVDTSKNPAILELIRDSVSRMEEATFKKIKHVFGPPENSRLEVWEIRMHDGGCFKIFNDLEYYQRLAIDEFPEVYQKAKKRCEEIRTAWEHLAAIVNKFADGRGYGPPDIPKRAEELRFNNH